MLFSTQSSGDKGTLYQLKNLVNRSAVPKDPGANMKAAEDFLLTVLNAHIIAAAETVEKHIGDVGVKELAKVIVSNYVLLPVLDAKKVPRSVDKVYLYACETLTLGLLWLGFYDAIKEGDGNRIMRYWRFLLVIFKSTRHPNYAKETVNLLLHFFYFFSERQKAQLLWSRCVNTKGYPGCNMPGDLHMEHLNRPVKGRIGGMGGNVSSAAIIKAGKALGVTKQVCSAFEAQMVKTKPGADKHSYPSLDKDIKKMVHILREADVFTPVKDRQHSEFTKMSGGVMQKYSRKVLLQRVQETIDNLI